MKTKKSYEELSKEGEARWEKLKAFAKAQPDYEAIAAEVNADIDAAFAMERARNPKCKPFTATERSCGTPGESLCKTAKPSF